MSNPNTTPKPIPGWVKIAFFGIPGRGSAVAMYWIAFAIGVIAASAAFAGHDDALTILSAVMGFGSMIVAHLSIKKMDELDGWQRPKS